MNESAAKLVEESGGVTESKEVSNAMMETGDAPARHLTAEEEEEAKRMEEIALRAEKRAAERAALKLQQQQEQEQQKQPEVTNTESKVADPPPATEGKPSAAKPKTEFLTKQQRQQLALDRLEERRKEQEEAALQARRAHNAFATGQLSAQERARRDADERLKREQSSQQHPSEKQKESEAELKAIREHYLGGPKEEKKKIFKASDKLAAIFKMDWEKTDDTARNDMNALYTKRLPINPLFGRGYIAGVERLAQREKSTFSAALTQQRSNEERRSEALPSSTLSREEREEREKQRERQVEAIRRQQQEEVSTIRSQDARRLGAHWSDKALEDMTERDWRIFREDFDIRIQGGRAVNPLRSWAEAKFPSEVLQAIKAVGYDKPSPIQRQAVPIGTAFRDVIGIAETGSGKTAAFVLPLLVYMLRLPPVYVTRCADEGPLAMIMAPTRELAQQIEEECIKLAAFTPFKTCCIVGGVAIEEQSVKLRLGVQIVIGTPGRMVDCLEQSFLVLNQCNYVVLDEADRMVDMGFEPQVVALLEAMGGLLKDEDEERAERQLALAAASAAAKNGLDQNGGSSSSSSSSSSSAAAATLGKDPKELFRVTAMFSATMPVEVERIAKTYLRHPAIIKIGDEDSGKNKRIEQRVMMIAEGQKKTKIIEELRKLRVGPQPDKAIVFVNAKKQGDVLARFLETSGFDCGVLHGGKSQEQREGTLEMFRRGEYRILLATDVAGRGLDIPDVSHVINFDCPAKIENYCHRIGRTGRAGKSGVATTFLTEGDSEVMYDLKAYLESTGAVVPPQLRNHEAAKHAAGSRGESGKLLGQKREFGK